LLHLQCHFGLDSLSWARLGARVTGVDLSSIAIAKAQQLAKKACIEAEFVCSDVYQFGEQNKQRYDVVYTSYGVLCWLPCMNKWAETVAKCLKPGGKIHLIEFHPFLDIKFGYDYFHQAEPDIEQEKTYSENAGDTEQTIAVWSHTLSDVISALIDAGIEIKSIEFDRWRIKEFKSACERAGVVISENYWHEVGQGFKDFSPRIEALEKAFLQERVRHGLHPVFNLGASSAIAVQSPAGDKKLDKSKSSNKIDAMVAMVMSVYPLLAQIEKPPIDVATAFG